MANENSVDQPGIAAPEPEAAPLPDYLTNPDAVSADEGVQWRFGKAPNYSNTRRVWAGEKTADHAAGSLPELVENLVKNWEVEASFKTRLSDWRTIDHENYTFAMNGEAPQTAEHMLKCGTYNAIIQSNEYYCPLHSDFASSHKTFKRMMPTFAWEVLEVYSGPPKVAFKWRHWGVMKNDYVGFNDKGEKVTAKAHGGPIEIFGVTVASVDDKVRLQNVDTYMDPLQMFRQIAPNGIVSKHPMNRKVELADALDPEPEHESTSTVSDVQQSASETTTHSSSLTTCPFAPPQQMDIEPSVRQPGATSVEFASTAVDVPIEMARTEPQHSFGDSSEASGTGDKMHGSLLNSQPHETESRDNDMDLDAQASKIVGEHANSNAQEAQPVLAGTEAAVEDSIPRPKPGDDNGMELDVQAPTIAKEHAISNAEATQPVLKDNEAAMEDDVTTSEPGDVTPPIGNAQVEGMPNANAEHSEQRTFDAIQAAGNLMEASESGEKRPNGDWQPPPTSETLPPQDVHPHPEDVEENEKPEGPKLL